jgi:uncharacterized protein YndB with AHSA1/START domain
MHTIENSIEVAAPLATLLTAITTRDGFRAWLNEDTDVDSAGRYTFTFAFAAPGETRAVTFTIDRADDRGIAMTCVHHENNPDWFRTKLAITLTPVTGGKTRVDLAHSGYSSKNEVYERSAQGWAHFLASLAQYATTGKGQPFVAALATPPAGASVAS